MDLKGLAWEHQKSFPSVTLDPLPRVQIPTFLALAVLDVPQHPFLHVPDIPLNYDALPETPNNQPVLPFGRNTPPQASFGTANRRCTADQDSRTPFALKTFSTFATASPTASDQPSLSATVDAQVQACSCYDDDDDGGKSAIAPAKSCIASIAEASC